MLMATDESLSDSAKAVNKVSRVVCESLSHSDSQHRPPDGRVKIKKGQQRPSNEMFVCFSPVPRPLLSPGREIVRDPVRRKAHSGPIFSVSPLSKGGKKQDYEDKDPTSPKVTCIGQVRANKKSSKTNDGFSDEHRQQKVHQSKLGWASPGRFFGSPSKPMMRTSFFGSRKESNPPSCTSHGSDVSCFHLPCNSAATVRSSREGKRRGTFLAKFLILLQESENRGRSKRERFSARDIFSQELEKRANERFDDAASTVQCVGNSASEASDAQPPANALLLTRRKLGSIGAFLNRSSSAPSHDRIKKRDKEDDLQPEKLPILSGIRERLRNFQSRTETREDEPWPLCPKSPESSQQSCESNALHNMVQHKCVERPPESVRPESCVLEENSSVDAILKGTSEQVDLHHEVCQKPVDGVKSEAEVINEETRKVAPAPPPSSPSAVRLRRCDWETSKISLDVVPETWLWKNRGDVPSDVDGELSSNSSVRGVQKVREETGDGEKGYGIHGAVDSDNEDFATARCSGELGQCEEQWSSIESPYEKVSIEEDTKGSYVSASRNESQYLSRSESGCCNLKVDQAFGLDLATNRGERSKDTACFNLEKQRYFPGLNARSQKRDVGKRQCSPKGKLFPDEMEHVDVEKQRYLIAFSGLDAECLKGDAGNNKSHSECLDLGKNSYRVALSDLARDSSHARKNSQHTSENTSTELQQIFKASEASNHEPGLFKKKKRIVPSPQSPNSVIFLGYNFETLSFSFNDRPFDGEMSHECNSLKGRLEVGRLSFKGTYSQWSKCGAEILHSCSPTSHPTVIRLKRCNSEPWRPHS